jgi:threonine synthase
VSLPPALITRYRALLPVTDATPVVSLGEGGTPLVPLERIGARYGLRLFAKFEGMNPTGSFKDRGMTLAVSKAVERGAQAVICASTGNTSASAAAYAARAGIRAAVVIPKGQIASGKLAQAIAHGARVISIDGNFDQALTVVRELADASDIELVNSVNPFRIAGQMTGAFEICDALGDAPEVLCIPVGNAGNITAYWAGFLAYHAAGHAGVLPRMMGFQAAGAAPLVVGHRVEHPETIATAIRIGNPASGPQALAAITASGGAIAAVTDAQILDAYRQVAQTEGIFCEPASAASLAGLLMRADAGEFRAGQTVVCVLTGHGLKDPDTAVANTPPVMHIAGTRAELERAVFDG